MKKNISQAVAKAALGFTKLNVNSICLVSFYQPRLPQKSEKLRTK